MDSDSRDVTSILLRLSAGDPDAESELLPLVYTELHRLASAQLRGERPGHTLQTTALVHEAYIRLCGASMQYQDRLHFRRVAARQMRRVLIDYARQRNAEKRGDGRPPTQLTEASAIIDPTQLALAIDIDKVLTRLETVDARRAAVVELRFYAGLSEEEIAEILHQSVRNVKRDWEAARAWLHAQLTRTK